MVPPEELQGYGGGRPRRLITLAVAVVCLFIAAYFALRPANEKRPPDFELPELTGGTLSSDELRGSPVVLNFFASWCPPCREEAPALEAAWRAYKDEGLMIVGVDVNDTEEDVRRFVREFEITYPIVRDENDTLVNELGLQGLPQTFFIDRNWELLEVSSGDQVGSATGDLVPLGAISEENLERNIERLLAGEARGP